MASAGGEILGLVDSQSGGVGFRDQALGLPGLQVMAQHKEDWLMVTYAFNPSAWESEA